MHSRSHCWIVHTTTPQSRWYTYDSVSDVSIRSKQRTHESSFRQNGQPVYPREHVYEQSLSSSFINHLSVFSNLWQTQAGLDDPDDSVDFCTWVQENLVDVPRYTLTGPSNSLFTQLGHCYPSTVNSMSTPGLTGITNSMPVLYVVIRESTGALN